MMMKGLCAAVLACVVLACGLTGVLSRCKGSGFGGCECNILGACDTSGKLKSGLDQKLTGYAPSGVEQFRYDKNPGSKPNLAYVCEGNTVAILYDCNARIPLYAATVMTGDQLNGPKTQRSSVDFQPSGDNLLDLQYQQTGADYVDSLSRNPCYESSGSNYFVEAYWYRGAKKEKPTKRRQPCNPPYNINTPVRKGQLIAAQFGRGDQHRTEATFTYTNVVPQFGAHNSDKSNHDADDLVKWGQNHCANHNGNATKNARMYIVVGALPSTFGIFQHRFFGESGFSDYQGSSSRADTYGRNTGKKKYRVNMPHTMWTAVCCTFQFEVEPGKWKDEVRYNAFYTSNKPGKDPNGKHEQRKMARDPAAGLADVQPVRVFPQDSRCNLDAHAPTATKP